MPQLLIFLIIVSVIVNVVKGINNAKSAQGEAGGIKTPHDFQGTNRSQLDRQWIEPRFIDRPDDNKFDESVVSKTEPNPVYKKNEKTMEKRPLRIHESTQQKAILSELTRDRLIEGIILTEILAAPKSKKHRII